MKILIVGAGRVGSSVAENLVSENNDITVIDTDSKQLSYLQERYDLRSVLGDASIPEVLEKANIADADLVVACASSDPVNLVVCKLARDMFNVPRCISRIRAPYYDDHREVLRDHFGIDTIISPEASVTQFLKGLVVFPDALQVVNFAQDDVSIAIIKLGKRSSLLDFQIDKNHLNLPNGQGRILELIRDGESLPLDRLFTLKAGDELAVAVDTSESSRIINTLSRDRKFSQSVMIAGGGKIGSRLAESLAVLGFNVRVIEKNKERCEFLAATLPEEVLVLNGNATDEALLVSENIKEMGTWIAITDDDEENIMSSLLAKRLGAQKVIAIITRQMYGELMEGSMIDVAVSPSEAIIGALMHEVRVGAIVRGHRLRRGEAEAIEFKVMGSKDTSSIIGKRMDQIHIPNSVKVAAIIRDGEVIIPKQDMTIESGDHAIIYSNNRKAMKRIEKIFQAPLLFV